MYKKIFVPVIRKSVSGIEPHPALKIIGYDLGLKITAIDQPDGNIQQHNKWNGKA